MAVPSTTLCSLWEGHGRQHAQCQGPGKQHGAASPSPCSLPHAAAPLTWVRARRSRQQLQAVQGRGFSRGSAAGGVGVREWCRRRARVRCCVWHSPPPTPRLTVDAPRLEGRQDEALALLGGVCVAAAARVPAWAQGSRQQDGQAAVVSTGGSWRCGAAASDTRTGKACAHRCGAARRPCVASAGDG